MALIDSETVLKYMGAASYALASTQEQFWADTLTPLAINLVKEEVGYEVELTSYTEYQPDQGMPVDDDQLIYGWEVVGGKAVPYDYRMQRARAIMQIRNLPLRQITSVYEAPSAWDDYPPDWPGGTLLSEGQHYRVDYENESFPGVDPSYPRLCWTGFLMRRIGVWSPVSRCVKVTYVAGYTDSELTGRFTVFRLAALQTAAFFVREAKMAGLKPGSTGVLIKERIEDWEQQFMAPKMPVTGMQYAMPPSVKKLLEPYVRYSKFRDG